jgi:nucleoid DNA-binding protein
LDTTAFIRELLLSHDCVIVPGFGGFIGNYSPARIDKSTDTFYPPVKQISFNRNLNHNDGLLIGKISGSVGVTYGDARSMVDDFVTETRKRLGRGEKVVFDNIGSFVNNQEGNTQFEPDTSANYHLDSFGLQAFQCSPLEGYDLRKRVLPYSSRDTVRAASIRRTLWRAAVIIPLLSLLVAVPLRMDRMKAKVESTTMNPLATAEFEHNKQAVEKTVSSPEVSKPESVPAETKTEVTAPKPVAPEPVSSAVSSEASYFLITGSFRSEENARQPSNMLKSDGYVPEVVAGSNGFYRVCAMSFNDYNLALHKKDSIIQKYPGAWVSRKK